MFCCGWGAEGPAVVEAESNPKVTFDRRALRVGLTFFLGGPDDPGDRSWRQEGAGIARRERYFGDGQGLPLPGFPWGSTVAPSKEAEYRGKSIFSRELIPFWTA